MKKNSIILRPQRILALIILIIAATLIFAHAQPILTFLERFISPIIGRSLLARGQVTQNLFLILFLGVIGAIILPFERILSKKIGATLKIIPETLLFLMLCAGIFFFFILSLRMRAVVDDYINMVVARDQTLIEKSISYYQEWSGRYTGPIVTYLYTLIPYRTLIRFFPVLTILILYISLFSLLRLFMGNVLPEAESRLKKTLARVFAAALTGGVLMITPNVYSSLYWFAGGTVYGFGLALSLATFACYLNGLRGGKSRPLFGAGILLAIAACGCNELTALSMCLMAFSTLGYQLLFLHPSRNEKTRAIIMLATCLICTLFSFAAPGNRARMTEHPEQVRVSLWQWAMREMLPGMLKVYQSFLTQFLEKGPVLICIALIFFLIGTLVHLKRERLTLILWLGASLLISSFFCFLTNATVMWAPARSLIAPTAWLLGALCLIVFSLGAALSRQSATVFRFGSLLTACLIFFFTCLNFYRDNIDLTERFARESDFRENALLQADPDLPVVETCKVTLLFKELDDLHEEPEFWVNQGMADFFHLQALSAKDDCADWAPK